MKNYGMVGIIQELIDYILGNFDPRSRSLEVRRLKSFLRITPFHTVIESRHKKKIII